MVASTPVLLELSKVEPIIKNDKMEEKYNKWQQTFDTIKGKRLAVIDDIYGIKRLVKCNINEINNINNKTSS